MSPLAIILLVISAFMHAAWNLRGKRENPTAAFFAAAALGGALMLSPIFLFFHERLAVLPGDVWARLAASGLCLAVYYIGLAAAYRLGDMSLAYPLARSSPLIVVTIVALVLGRGHEISPPALIGIVMVVGGCFLLPMARFSDLRLSNYLNACSAMALLAAFATAGYSIVDDEALRRMRELPGGPFTPVTAAMLYMVLEAAAAAVWLGLFVAVLPRRRGEWRALGRPALQRAAGVGVMIYLTYGLVLLSMAFVSNVSYVVAFRQLSIPIGATLGIMVLREPCPPPKIVGLAVLVAGLILVATG